MTDLNNSLRTGRSVLMRMVRRRGLERILNNFTSETTGRKALDIEKELPSGDRNAVCKEWVN